MPTLVLGEDVRGGVLFTVGSPRGQRAEQPRVDVRQGADAQRQRGLDKRAPHVVHL